MSAEQDMDVSSLLEKARAIEITPEMKRRQRISFAYGNVHLSNPNVTRKMVEDAAERLEKNANLGR